MDQHHRLPLSALHLNALLAKYSQQLPADVATQLSSAANQPASRVQICSQCQGHRLEKVAYGFMIVDRNCSKCDGEGVIPIKTSPRLHTVQSA